MAAQAVYSSRAARYICPCGSVWDDFKRDRADLGGRWQGSGKRAGHGDMVCPASLTFRRPSLLGAGVAVRRPFGDCLPLHHGGEDLKVRETRRLQGFHERLPRRTVAGRLQPALKEAVLALRDERPSGVLPSTEKRWRHCWPPWIAGFRLRYRIRAFGYGQECESWQCAPASWRIWTRSTACCGCPTTTSTAWSTSCIWRA